MRSYRVEEIEGIGPAYGAKLREAGIPSTSALLKRCASRKGREEVATTTGISETLVLTWTNMADLMRIKGVGKQAAELLQASGVDTVKELRNRRADNLAAKMKEVNTAKRLTRATPAEANCIKWIEEAKTLEPIMTY